MDNITHSLIGYTLGQSIFGRAEKKLNKAAIWTAILGNNFPDLDTFFIACFSNEKINYLLHHRGYSHTALLSLPIGIISGFLGWRIARLKGKPSANILVLGILSVLLHIAADFWNNYGVHPFWPFWNHWIYGDFIFILEPFIWLSLLPYIYFSVKRVGAKILVATLGILLLAFLWLVQAIPWQIALACSVWSTILILAQKRILHTRYAKIIPALVAFLITLFSFHLGSKLARSKISHPVSKIVSTPAPGNPFCWTIITLEHQDEFYLAKLGVLSLAPKIFPNHTCYFKKAYPINLEESSNGKDCPGGACIQWIYEFRRPLQEFLELAHSNCQFQAFLKFARIPIWQVKGESTYVSDLRYENSQGNGFSTIQINSKKGKCPQNLPAWDPPTWYLQSALN